MWGKFKWVQAAQSHWSHPVAKNQEVRASPTCTLLVAECSDSMIPPWWPVTPSRHSFRMQSKLELKFCLHFSSKRVSPSVPWGCCPLWGMKSSLQQPGCAPGSQCIGCAARVHLWTVCWQQFFSDFPSSKPGMKRTSAFWRKAARNSWAATAVRPQDWRSRIQVLLWTQIHLRSLPKSSATCQSGKITDPKRPALSKKLLRIHLRPGKGWSWSKTEFFKILLVNPWIYLKKNKNNSLWLNGALVTFSIVYFCWFLYRLSLCSWFLCFDDFCHLITNAPFCEGRGSWFQIELCVTSPLVFSCLHSLSCFMYSQTNCYTFFFKVKKKMNPLWTTLLDKLSLISSSQT